MEAVQEYAEDVEVEIFLVTYLTRCDLHSKVFICIRTNLMGLASHLVAAEAEAEDCGLMLWRRYVDRPTDNKIILNCSTCVG